MVRACVDPDWDQHRYHAGRFIMPTSDLLLTFAGISMNSWFCEAHESEHHVWRPMNECGVSAIAELTARQNELIAKVNRLRFQNQAIRRRAFEASVAQIKRWPHVAFQYQGFTLTDICFSVDGEVCFG